MLAGNRGLSDTIGHMTDNAISEVLITYLTITEIVDAFIDLHRLTGIG